MEKEKRIQYRFPGWLAGPCILLLLGLWHLKDTYAGAAGSQDWWLIGQYIILFAAVLFLAGFSGWQLIRRKVSSSRVFAVCALVLGVMYLFVLPPLSAPDEIRHYISAYQLSNQIMGKEVMDENGYVYIRTEDDFIDNIDKIDGWENRRTLGQILDEETYRLIHEKGFFKSSEQGTMISCQLPVKTTPFAYLPQALGITAARLLNLNCIGLAFLGRFFNLLFFIALICMTLSVIPFGKSLIFGVGILPMTLHLATSFSYDSMIIGMCFYFAAYCLHLAYRKEQVEWKDIAVLAIVAAWVGPCKMVYAAVLGFAFLIPVRKFGGWKQWAISAAIVLAAFVTSMFLVNSQVIASYAGGADSYVGWAEQEGYSLPYILHNPLRYAEILYQTLLTQGEFYFVSAFGGYLGNLDPVLNVPFLLVLALFGSLFFLSIKKKEDTLYFKTGQKVWIWVLFAACSVGVMTAMLISWTPLSSDYIHGVQGRYLLPLLPFVLMTLAGKGLVLTKNHDREILYGMCIANGYVLLRLFSIVSMRL